MGWFQRLPTYEDQLLPIAAQALGGPETTAGLSRTHAEIVDHGGCLGPPTDEVEHDAAAPQDVLDLRSLHYALYAMLRLHNAQGDEQVFGLIPTLDRDGRPDRRVTPPPLQHLVRAPARP